MFVQEIVQGIIDILVCIFSPHVVEVVVVINFVDLKSLWLKSLGEYYEIKGLSKCVIIAHEKQ